MLMPSEAVPALKVPTLAHGDFDLAADAAPRFTPVAAYRGLHRPICAKYLPELGCLQPEFDKRGVKVIALSSDKPERAQAIADKLKSPGLRIGRSLPLADAKAWGLSISSSRSATSIGIEQPALFAEPGVFIVQPARHAELRRGADHAVRPPELRRAAGGAGLCDQQGLPGTRRVRRGGLSDRCGRA